MVTDSTSSVLFLQRTGRRRIQTQGMRLDTTQLIALHLPIDATRSAQGHELDLEGRSSDRGRTRQWVILETIPLGG